jgi:hypothetical protein
MGNDNHVSHKLFGFQGHVGSHIIVAKEPFVVSLKFQPFSLHIFSQASQNITVKVRVVHSVRKNKFMVNYSIHIKKTMSMFFVELRTCHAFFAVGDCELFHCNDCCFVSGS